jgi:hypothetical protein
MLAAKAMIFAVVMSAGMLAAGLAVSGAPPPVLPNGALAPMPPGFGTLDRFASVTTPLPAMPVTPQS